MIRISRPGKEILPVSIAFAGAVLIWFVPLLYIIWPAAAGTTFDAAQAIPGGSAISPPPAWFDTDSPLVRWPELIFRSLRLSLLAAISATSLGMVIAFLLTRCRWKWASTTSFIWFIALFIPLPVVATVWLGAFANLGRSQAFGIAERPIVSGWVAAWLVHSIAALPLVVTILGAAFTRTDGDLEDMARSQHMPFAAIVRSVFRTARPAILASLLIVLIVTAGDMTVTDLVQERTFAEETYLQAQMGDGLGAAARTALPMTVLVAGFVMGWAWFESRKFGEIFGPGIRKTAPRHWFSGHAGTLAGFFVMIASCLCGVLPMIALIWRAGRSGGLAAVEQFPRWSTGALIRNTADALPDLSETVFWSMLLAFLVALAGTIVAWCMVQSFSSSIYGRVSMAAGAALGLAVPGPLAGLAVLWLWMGFPRLYDSLFVVVASILFRFLGISVFLIWSASVSIPDDLEELATLEGLSGAERFRRIRWPYMGKSVTVSAFVLFAFAVSELPAANITVPPGVELMSVRLWSLMHTGMESHLASFVLNLVCGFAIFFSGLTLWCRAVLRRMDAAS